MGDESIQGLEEAFRQPTALSQDPGIEAAREQLAAVQLNRPGQPACALLAVAGLRRRLESRLEFRDVGGHRRRVQADREAVGDEDGARRDARRLHLVAEPGERDGAC